MITKAGAEFEKAKTYTVKAGPDLSGALRKILTPSWLFADVSVTPDTSVLRLRSPPSVWTDSTIR